MVRGPRFELGTPIFSAGCLKWRRGHKSLRHNLGSSTHSCKSFTALHRVARGNVYGIRIGSELTQRMKRIPQGLHQRADGPVEKKAEELWCILRKVLDDHSEVIEAPIL